jgi:hypothetical protein
MASGCEFVQTTLSICMLLLTLSTVIPQYIPECWIKLLWSLYQAYITVLSYCHQTGVIRTVLGNLYR